MESNCCLQVQPDLPITTVHPIDQPTSSSQSSTWKELLSEIQALDKAHTASRTSRKVAHRLQPFVAFVERYSPAIDVGIQGISSPATVVWGCLRVIFVVSQHQLPFTHTLCVNVVVVRLGSSVFHSISRQLYRSYRAARDRVIGVRPVRGSSRRQSSISRLSNISLFRRHCVSGESKKSISETGQVFQGNSRDAN